MKILKEDKYFQYGLSKPIKWYWLKRILYGLIDAYYQVLVRLIPMPKENSSLYQLSLILIFKDEAPYLQEWLEYHLMLGVQHFYLYQNNSTDDYAVVLQPYIDQGLVTLIEWPDHPGQYSAYYHWYQNYRHESYWASFIDIDEFLCPFKETSLVDMLRQYEKYPVVLVYWKLFGTSGIMQHDYNKLVVEQYHCSRPKLFSEGKIIYNTRFDAATNLITMHGMDVKWHGIKIPPVNTFKRFIVWDLHHVNWKNDAVLQLNHYWSKSFESWRQKHEKGSVEKGIRYRDYPFFERLEVNCTSVDYTIYRFLVKLKLRMSSLLDK